MRAGTLDGWFGGFLPDLNQDDPEVARYIIQNTLWWVATTGVDGIRQDTWQYVPRSFWKPWMAAIKREYPALRVVGEVFDGDPSVIAFHLDGTTHWDGIDTKVDYMFDFPLHFALRDAFARGGSLRQVAMMLGRDHVYPDASRLVPFAGNHDVERFMNEKGATLEGLKLANTFLLTVRGAPLLYYGDEIALPGGRDPDNRRDFPGGWPGDPRDAFTAAGRTPAEQGVWAHVQRLLQIRAERADLRRAPMEHLVAEEQLFVYKRGMTVVALNNDTVPVNARIPIGLLGDDLLGICGKPRADGRVVVVAIPKRSGCIFPVTSAAIPGPALGVTGEVRHHLRFESKLVAPRNVEVWLPPGYRADRAARYPVLYMHDGQNVFNPATSYTGVDWGVDETMTRLIAAKKIRPAIVVGVWNTDKRFEEYMPRKAVAGDSLRVGPGRAMPASALLSDAYLKFLVTELKPYIDRTYRTRPGREDTFIMGSSMGALISLYAVGEYPQVFGGAAAVSTHWPAGNGAVIDYLKRAAPDPKLHRLYFDHGTATLDATYAPFQARADSAMRALGYTPGTSYASRTFDGADHSERAWRTRVDVPLEFLLGR
jgi:predicted alpha/beta superfamily hydrolase